MRHHFGDLLARGSGYWTMVPNRERYAYRVGDAPEGSSEVTIVTLGKEDEQWARVRSFPNLEEVTLHEPTAEQLAAVGELRSIKRLRITHARPRSLEFIGGMSSVEELVLEYVSGFSDLSPLRQLPRLRALHLENLRAVSDFSGLAGVKSLRYLAIYGTTDWRQPILDFEFLRGLTALEVLALWEITTKKPYPALLPVLSLAKLEQVRVHRSYFAVEEYALLEEGLQGAKGANWGPFGRLSYAQLELPADDPRAQLSPDVLKANHPEVTLRYDGKRLIADPDTEWFEFTGKAGGRAKCTSPTAAARCRDYAGKYIALKQRARQMLDEGRRS